MFGGFFYETGADLVTSVTPLKESRESEGHGSGATRGTWPTKTKHGFRREEKLSGVHRIMVSAGLRDLARNVKVP